MEYGICNSARRDAGGNDLLAEEGLPKVPLFCSGMSKLPLGYGNDSNHVTMKSVTKPLHFPGLLHNSAVAGGNDVFGEEGLPEVPPVAGLRCGYAQSKWVAERLAWYESALLVRSLTSYFHSILGFRV